MICEFNIGQVLQNQYTKTEDIAGVGIGTIVCFWRSECTGYKLFESNAWLQITLKLGYAEVSEFEFTVTSN